jgi:hypothetical protein
MWNNANIKQSLRSRHSLTESAGLNALSSRRSQPGIAVWGDLFQRMTDYGA